MPRKNISSDCIICAMRPGLYLTQINIYQARFFCSHSVPSSAPHFQPSIFLKIITLACNFILLLGAYNDLNRISENFFSKQVLIFLEIVINIMTVIFNVIFLKKNKIRLDESHGLIALINNKRKFGVEVILTSKTAENLHHVLFYLMVLFISEEIIMFNIAFAIDDVDDYLFVRILILEVLFLLNGSLGFFAVQILFLYKTIFTTCFEEIQNFLSTKFLLQMSEDDFVEKLQKLQRFYMSLRRNFKLNEEFLREVLLFYSLYICLLLIGYVYFVLTFILGEVGMLKFDIYLLLKSSAIAMGFGYLSHQVQQISEMSENILSFLFKYKINKLSPLELAQIDELIFTLVLQKADIRVSDIFTVGTKLLAAISGTVLTYVLVALQFHAFWFQK